MAKRQITITIDESGKMTVDNSANPDERKILEELGELAELLTGSKTGYKIEQHTHKHGGHVHTHQHVGGKS